MDQATKSELERRAAAYYDEIMRPSVVSYSHITLAKMFRDFGEKATLEAIEPHFEQHREQVKEANWTKIVNFYAQHGAAPHPDHPSKPKRLRDLERARQDDCAPSP